MTIWALPAFVFFAAMGTWLSIHDAKTKRLPNKQVVQMYGGTAGLLLLPAAIEGMWAQYATALLGGAVMFAVYLALALINPRGMGMGDVKFAAPLGTALGWFGWGALLLGLAAGFLVGALVSIGLMFAGRATRDTKIPFGPSMFIGAGLVALLAI